ncbi:T9SS type A sorting domain-containing protein [bacterium]|nr:T9SS type A sorting domain-containing protein [bacterium]
MRFTVAILIILFAFSAFGQGEPHSLYGFLQNSDSSIPTTDCISFCGYYGVQSFCFPEDSGIGSVRYLESSGAWLIHTEIFDPAPVHGEEITLFFWNECAEEGANVPVTLDLSYPSQNLGSVTLGLMGIGEISKPEVVGIRAYPNPFNAACTITGANEVGIYDISGKIVRYISGEGTLVWNGRSDLGDDMPSGVYFIKDRSCESITRILLLR